MPINSTAGFPEEREGTLKPDIAEKLGINPKQKIIFETAFVYEDEQHYTFERGGVSYLLKETDIVWNTTSI